MTDIRRVTKALRSDYIQFNRSTEVVVTEGWSTEISLQHWFAKDWFDCEHPSFYYWPNPKIFKQLLDYTKGHFYTYMEIRETSGPVKYQMRLIVRTQTADDAIMSKLSLVIDSYVLDQYK